MIHESMILRAPLDASYRKYPYHSEIAVSIDISCVDPSADRLVLHVLELVIVHASVGLKFLLDGAVVA